MIDFSKIKGITIPQGKVKDISVGGVKVWKESTPEEPTYTVSGVWMFNDTLNDGGVRDSLWENVTFISNEETFDYVFIENYINGQTKIWYADTVIYNNRNTSSWLNNAYKTVDFGSTPQAVSQEFYEWLTANASRKEISFTIDGTSYRAYEGMTWSEWVNSSFNTDGYNIEGDIVMFRGGGIVEYSNGDLVRPTDIINATNYILGSPGGGSN